MTSLLYQSKEARDIKAKELQAKGFRVKRSSTRNQLIHPQYVEDANPHLRAQTGFGNTVYNTHYSVLYEVEIV